VDNRFDRKIEPLALPKSCLSFRDMRRMQKDASCFKAAVFVQHLEKPGRIVMSL
jgi:hypothetical protein